MKPTITRLLFVLATLVAACAPVHTGSGLAGFSAYGRFGEQARVLELYPDVTATIVLPTRLDLRKRVDLILYALPNGNTTGQTMGRRLAEGVDWHYDIQHVGAQTRALRDGGMSQAVVVYLEASQKSWPAWRSSLGYERANPRIVGIVDEIRAAIGNPSDMGVTLTGHSGGGSFTWGFIDGQPSLPDWLDRIAFLDSNYSFEPQHGAKIVEWLRRDRGNTLIVLAYDDRNIMLDGTKVVSDSGGTWRASHRMIDNLQQSFPLVQDTLGAFIRYRSEQIRIMLHPNPANRILHTEMIGEMNGYMHALLVRRPHNDDPDKLLTPSRAYNRWIEADVFLPPAASPDIPRRRVDAVSGSTFIGAIATMSRDARETAIKRELLAGNIPSFLRRLSRVKVSAADSNGVMQAIQYDVMPDYLAIGSDKDFVRMPMTPQTAQAFCDAFGFVLPTRKMVGDIWKNAEVRVGPHPLTEQRESPLTFLQHHRIVEEQLKAIGRGKLTAGMKKDIVVTPRLDSSGRVAIFGWHRESGVPIQPLYTGHVDWYVDYSHGVRPVRRSMRVNAATRTFESVLADPMVRHLVSDEDGPVVTRYR